MKQFILSLSLLVFTSCNEALKEKVTHVTMDTTTNPSNIQKKTNTIIKVTLSKVDSVLYRKNNIEHVLDDEKDSVIITSNKYYPTIYSKIDLQRILTYFPILNDSFPKNPDASYMFSGVWKRYIDTAETEQEISFSSEAGQDGYYQLYAYFLKKKTKKSKFDEPRKKLLKIYNDINNIFATLASGGTYFGHQSKRIAGYVEYATHWYAKGFYDSRTYDVTSQKHLFNRSLKQTITDEISIQDDTFTPKEKQNKKLELFKTVDEIDKLITDYFFLKNAQEFRYSHY